MEPKHIVAVSALVYDAQGDVLCVKTRWLQIPGNYLAVKWKQASLYDEGVGVLANSFCHQSDQPAWQRISPSHRVQAHPRRT